MPDFQWEGKTSPSIHGFLFLDKESELPWKCWQKGPAKRYSIPGESGSQDSEGADDLERDDCISHTPKVGPVSKCNRTSFSFIKYLDN